MQISTVFFVCENIEIQWNKLWWNCSFVAKNILILTKFRRRKRSTEAWGMERSLWLAACCEIFNPWIGNGTRCSHWAIWHPDSNVLRRFAWILFWNVLIFYTAFLHLNEATELLHHWLPTWAAFTPFDRCALLSWCMLLIWMCFGTSMQETSVEVCKTLCEMAKSVASS